MKYLGHTLKLQVSFHQALDYVSRTDSYFLLSCFDQLDTLKTQTHTLW